MGAGGASMLLRLRLRGHTEPAGLPPQSLSLLSGSNKLLFQDSFQTSIAGLPRVCSKLEFTQAASVNVMKSCWMLRSPYSTEQIHYGATVPARSPEIFKLASRVLANPRQKGPSREALDALKSVDCTGGRERRHGRGTAKQTQKLDHQISSRSLIVKRSGLVSDAATMAASQTQQQQQQETLSWPKHLLVGAALGCFVGSILLAVAAQAAAAALILLAPLSPWGWTLAAVVAALSE